MQTQNSPTVQSLEAAGNGAMDTIKHLLHEGNIRKISIKQDDRVVAEFR